MRDISQRILRTNEQTISLTIENILGQKEVVVNTVKDKYFPNEVVSHKIINENIGYIYLGSLKKGEIHQIMDKFLDKKGLIVDLRCYPSDFVVFRLSNYL